MKNNKYILLLFCAILTTITLCSCSVFDKPIYKFKEYRNEVSKQAFLEDFNKIIDNDLFYNDEAFVVEIQEDKKEKMNAYAPNPRESTSKSDSFIEIKYDSNTRTTDYKRKTNTSLKSKVNHIKNNGTEKCDLDFTYIEKSNELISLNNKTKKGLRKEVSTTTNSENMYKIKCNEVLKLLHLYFYGNVKSKYYIDGEYFTIVNEQVEQYSFSDEILNQIIQISPDNNNIIVGISNEYVYKSYLNNKTKLDLVIEENQLASLTIVCTDIISNKINLSDYYISLVK